MGKVSVWMGDVNWEYGGDVEAGLGPEGTLVITEQVPNVTGKGEATKPKMKAIFKEWDFVEVE